MKLIKITSIIIIFFILINISYSEVFYSKNNELNILNNNYLKLNILENISFDISFENKYKIDYIKISDYFFPKNYKDKQYINDYFIYPKNYQIKNESNNLFLVFNYDSTNINKKNIINKKFTIQSLYYSPNITGLDKFPIIINKNNKELIPYLKFYKYINTNEKIKTKTYEITNGINNSYLAAIKIANWINNNIEYNLSTIRKSQNLTSVEVFKIRKGVCREITNLFISMCRTIGIPARVVNGYAYTNQKDLITYLDSNWGGHSWAEIWINGTWVPFDLTYKEYGYLDSIHIIASKSYNSSFQNLNANGYGYGFKFETLNNNFIFKPIESFNVSLKNNIEKLKINVDTIKNVGFGSYDYIKIKITNPTKYYVPINLNIVKTKEIINKTNNEVHYIVKPFSTITYNYLFKIPENLNSGYKYTFYFNIELNSLKENKIKIESENDFKKIDYIQLEDLKKENNIILNFKNNLKFNKNLLEINCIDINNTNKEICFFKNYNNFKLYNLEIYLNNKLKKIFNLNIAENKSLNITLKNSSLNNLSIKYNKENLYQKIINISNTQKINSKNNISIKNLKNNSSIKNEDITKKTPETKYTIDDYIKAIIILIREIFNSLF